MRISDNSVSSAISRQINTIRSEHQNKQIQISLGRKYQKRSDDPVTATDSTRLTRESAAHSQWYRNVESAQTYSQVSESSLTRLLECLQRSKELATQANDATQPDGNLHVIAEEVNGILEDVVMIANTSFADAYLFAGTDATTAPVSVTRVDGDITAFSYDGAGTRREVQVGENVRANYGYVAGGTDGVFEATGAGVDMLQTLIDFRNELEAGTVPSAATLQKVQDSLDHVLIKTVENGIDQRRLERVSANVTAVGSAIDERLAQVQQIDLAEALTDLSGLETSLQASLQMAARIGKLNLLNYI